jgi:sugar O-acyltransferase (sialic acid O-acetyltransferase NeuD family)
MPWPRPVGSRCAMPRELLILGTGGNSIDILETALAINKAGAEEPFQPIGFLDDAPSMQGRLVQGHSVLGPLAEAGRRPDAALVNGIGNPSNYRDKAQIIAKASDDIRRFVTLLHPSASVSPSANLSPGTVILQNVTVANQVDVGSHVIILPNTVLSHGVTIGAYTSVAGGATICGEVQIGSACYIGAGVSIRERLKIGEGSLIGMGSVVIRDVAENAVVYGNPAT